MAVKDGGFQVDSFDELFIDQKDWGSGPLISLLFVGDTLEGDFGWCECEDSEFWDVDSSSHSEVSADVEAEGVPDDSHLLIVKGSL